MTPRRYVRRGYPDRDTHPISTHTILKVMGVVREAGPRIIPSVRSSRELPNAGNMVDKKTDKDMKILKE